MKKSTVLIMIILAELIALIGVLIFYNTIPPNKPPVADAGVSQTVWAGSMVQLDGGMSEDPESSVLIYNWTLISKPAESLASILDSTTVNPSLLTDIAGEYEISLVVSDGQGYSLPSKIVVVAEPWFKDVAMQAGVMMGPEAGEDRRSSMWMGPGCGWADYDNDGDPDLYVPFGGFWQMVNLLYRNNGDGTFTDVAKEAGVDYRGNSFGVAWADYDNDGDLDLYLANYGNASHWTDLGEANILYRNNGDGTFTDVTEEAGVGDMGHGMAAAWGDYNNDGNLDLFVANRGIVSCYLRQYKNETSVLYKNNGDGTFTNVAPELDICQGETGIFVFAPGEKKIARYSGHWWTPIWFDYNNDEYLDLFITSDLGTSLLYRNDGPPNYGFTEVTKDAGMWVYNSGMGADIGDYDNDGDMDIYVCNYGAGTAGWNIAVDVNNYLWRNNGDGTFTEVAEQVGVDGYGGVAMASIFFDFDNDGDLDLFVSYGTVGWKAMTAFLRETFSRDQLFLNNGDGTFTDVTNLAGIGNTMVSQGAAVADFDNDGDLDIYSVNSDDFNNLFKNNYANSLGNNWIRIKLNGTISNRNGIGAEVRVISGDLNQVRQLISGSHYESTSDLEACLHYGLGKRVSVDRIEVKWPSGIQQVITDISVNQTITITETL